MKRELSLEFVAEVESLPTRERELKLGERVDERLDEAVAPYTGA